MYPILAEVSSLGDKWTSYVVQVDDKILIAHLTNDALTERVEGQEMKLGMGDMSMFSGFVPQAFFKK